MLMAEELPTRIVGDPLQGIFGFSDIVDWRSAVAPEFERLVVSDTPWRWMFSNTRLGHRLHEIRQCLIEGRPFTLAPEDAIVWQPYSAQNQVRECLKAVRPQHDVVAIHKWPAQCHGLAKKLRNRYSSMEELAGKDLLRAATALDSAEGGEVTAAVLDFVQDCATRVPPGITAATEVFRSDGRIRVSAKRTHKQAYTVLNSLAEKPSPAHLLESMKSIERLPGLFVHRKECWHEMKRAISILASEPAEGGLRAAVLKVRDRTRRIGRVPERRSISRSLLVKGLEYHHAIVLNADQLTDARELYVALTRGHSFVTVLSKSRRFQRPPVPID
jgi:hypothetical protein